MRRFERRKIADPLWRWLVRGLLVAALGVVAFASWGGFDDMEVIIGPTAPGAD